MEKNVKVVSAFKCKYTRKFHPLGEELTLPEKRAIELIQLGKVEVMHVVKSEPVMDQKQDAKPKAKKER
jgi:hypothetical protein